MEPEAPMGSSVLIESGCYNGLLERSAKGSCPRGLRAEGKSLIFREVEVMRKGEKRARGTHSSDCSRRHD